MGKIYKNQTGVNIQLDTRYDLSNASEARILYKRPDGVSGYWNALIEGSIISYITRPNDLSLSKTWFLQAYIQVEGSIFYGETALMDVFELFK